MLASHIQGLLHPSNTALALATNYDFHITISTLALIEKFSLF